MGMDQISEAQAARQVGEMRRTFHGLDESIWRELQKRLTAHFQKHREERIRTRLAERD